jgi:hypothetical protein
MAMNREEHLNHSGDRRAVRKTPRPKNRVKPAMAMHETTFAWSIDV